MKAPTKLDGLPVKVVTVVSQESHTIGAGSVYDFEVTPETISGYTPVGLVSASSIGSGTSNLAIRRFGITGNGKARITIQNAGSNSVTVNNVTFGILYIKA